MGNRVKNRKAKRKKIKKEKRQRKELLAKRSKVLKKIVEKHETKPQTSVGFSGRRHPGTEAAKAASGLL